MTNDELLVVATSDARAAYECFDHMTTSALEHLQIAHQIDQEHATTPEAIAFGGGRLALIAAVLRKRRGADR